MRRVAFSPDGAFLATASDDDGSVRVWDARAGRSIGPTITNRGRVSHVEFSPDGRLLATASNDGTAVIWEARTGRPPRADIAPMRHDNSVGEVSFSPDGGRLVTAGLDGTARIWDVATGAPLSPPFSHGGSLRRARFSSDGFHVLTVSDSIAQLWDTSQLGGLATQIDDPDGVLFATFFTRRPMDRHRR